MSANVDAMVNEGVNAFKAGRKEEARALLLKATELDQYNEQAWLWLSGLMEDHGLSELALRHPHRNKNRFFSSHRGTV